MAVDVTSYAVLGLKPGADRAAIEKAYRRLIKLHHPDHAGGDGKQAAEINRAYFELRDQPVQEPQRPPPNVAEAIYRRRAHRSRVAPPRQRTFYWKWLAAAGVLGLLWAERTEVGKFGDALSLQIASAIEPATAYQAPPVLPEGPDALENPLDSDAIAQSIAEVRGRLGRGEVGAVAEMSWACHRAMRTAPSSKQLDRCAAIDFTAVAIVGNDPMLDEGPFGASAVTAREMTAARLLSADYLLIDARFDQIRGRVEAALNVPRGAEDQSGRTALPARRPD